jgi:hypothetical protein
MTLDVAFHNTVEGSSNAAAACWRDESIRRRLEVNSKIPTSSVLVSCSFRMKSALLIFGAAGRHIWKIEWVFLK